MTMKLIQSRKGSTALTSTLLTTKTTLPQPQAIQFLCGSSSKIRLLIADAHTVARQSLVNALTQEDLKIVGQASNSEETLELAMRLLPDVVVMDSCMPDCDGIIATREIHRLYPWIEILVLTYSEKTELMWRSLEAGASDYLLKSTPHEEIVSTVRGLYHGVIRKKLQWYYPSQI
jgi:DNA-binding NarL/FixJ family response regulator